MNSFAEQLFQPARKSVSELLQLAFSTRRPFQSKFVAEESFIFSQVRVKILYFEHLFCLFGLFYYYCGSGVSDSQGLLKKR